MNALHARVDSNVTRSRDLSPNPRQVTRQSGREGWATWSRMQVPARPPDNVFETLALLVDGSYVTDVLIFTNNTSRLNEIARCTMTLVKRFEEKRIHNLSEWLWAHWDQYDVIFKTTDAKCTLDKIVWLADTYNYSIEQKGLENFKWVKYCLNIFDLPR